MPIYEYRCDVCGYEMEAIQKFSDAALRNCPICGKPELKKLVSAAGFQLRGTGWYVMDFRDKDKKKPKADSESASKDKSKGEKKEKKASASSSSDD